MITNRDQLLKGRFKEARGKVIDIIEAGITASLARNFMPETIRLTENELVIGDSKFHLPDFDKVYVIGFGKASGLMAKELEKILDNRIDEGVVVTKGEFSARRIRVIEGDHPIPSSRNVSAADEITSAVQKAGENDLVLCLISGGGSAQR